MPNETTQQKLIRAATKRALESRDPYSEQIAADLSLSLERARKDAVDAVVQFRAGGTTKNAPSITLMNGLQKELDRIMGRLSRSNTVAFLGGMRGSFNLGIVNSIGSLVDAGFPRYRDLSPTGINRLATKAFTLVDTDALDFMSEYTLVLAGDVNTELASGLKRAILTGVATGKSAEDIVRDMGGLVDDPKSFRQAGGRVFPTAKNRLQAIARTEILRAHNQGGLKFLQRVGVEEADWLAMADERMCPVCGSLDGHSFPVAKFPNQPAHTHCRCTHVAKITDNILLPTDIETQYEAQRAEVRQLDRVFDAGSVTDLNALTFRQLRMLSRTHGVGMSRTRDDFLRLIQAADPTGFQPDLGGEELRLAIKRNGIGLMRNKEDLAKLLAAKRVSLMLEKIQRDIETGKALTPIKTSTEKKIPPRNTPKNTEKDKLPEQIRMLRKDVQYRLSQQGALAEATSEKLHKYEQWRFSKFKEMGIYPESTSHEQYEADIIKGMKGLVAENRGIYTRTDIDGLRGILADGRIKSQYETGTAHGLMDKNGARRNAEYQMFGYATDLAPEERPIYCYLHPEASAIQNDAQRNLDKYGNIAIKLRSGVSDRTTVSYGDSMALSGGSDGIPSAMNNPQAHSIDGVIFGMHFKEYRPGTLIYPVNDYLEAQIHGQVGVGDIEGVTFIRDGSETADNISLQSALIEDLRKSGINATIEEVKRDGKSLTWAEWEKAWSEKD